MTMKLAMITVDAADALALVTDDLDAEVQRLVGAGASKIADREMPGFRWTTLSDPAGNEFCVTGGPEAV